jgi:peptide/nickel transport system substrate-binding protein
MTIVAHVEPRDLVKWADPKYYWRYNNTQLQALVAQADAGSADDYVRLMKQAAKLLADDAAADWLFLLPNLVVTTSDVTGIGANATSLSFDLTTIASR